MIFIWLACAAPSQDTLVDELRVLGLFTDVPEVMPGQTVDYDTLVFDPYDSHDLLQWTCTSLFPGECAEAELDIWDGLTLNEPLGQFQVSMGLSAVANEEPLPLVSRWALACEPGVCPFLEDLNDNLSEPLSEDLTAMLQDPTLLLEGLPFEGVSLAYRQLNVSMRQSPDINPSISCEEVSEAEPLETVEFLCGLSGNFDKGAAVWGYTTAGAWIGDSVSLSAGDSEISYSLQAPEDTGEVSLWLVIVDGGVGTEVWSSTLTVR